MIYITKKVIKKQKVTDLNALRLYYYINYFFENLAIIPAIIKITIIMIVMNI